MLRVQSPDEVVREALALARASSLMTVLYVLERGESLYNASAGGSRWLGSMPEAGKERIRKLREQLVERDLYEAIYGPLPPRCCDPESREVPDFGAAAPETTDG